MKRIIGLLLLLLICKISFSQTFPSTLPVSSPNQMYKALGGFTAGVGFIITQYADTLTANANSYIKNYPFAQIATSDGSVYYRNQTATAWIKFNTSVSAGTLTNLAFTNLNGLNGVVTNPESTPNLTLSTPLNGLIRANGTSFLTTTIGTGLAFDGTTLSATNSGTVLDVGSNSLNPIFNSSVANASTHPVISYTLQSSAAYTILGNNTNSTTTQTYFSPILASALFRNQGTSTTLLHGTASGNPFWGQVVTPDIADNAVTFVKMQNINAQTLLGNNKVYGGLVREITLGSGLTLDTTTAVLSATSTGTVKSISLVVPSIFTVSGSPVVGTGTFTVTASSAKGDIIYADANNSYNKLPIGNPKQHLIVRNGLPAWGDTAVNNGSSFVSVSGTANRIIVANGTTNATVDIASNYVGQPSIITLSNTTGVTTGIWKATKIDVPYGGLNLTSVTLGGIPYGSSSNVYSIIPAGTQGQLLRINSNIPQWFTPTYLLPADTSGKWLTHVYRKIGTDSVKETRGGVDYFSFIDSTGITAFTNGNGFLGTIASKSLTLATNFTGLAFSDGTGLSAVNIGTGLTLNNSTKLLDWNGVNVRKGGVAPTFTERMINFIEGSGVTITLGDDPGNNRVNVTIASTGGGGGVSDFIFTDGNGFDGTVTLSTTTPTLSLATNFTGFAYSNGTGLSAATISTGLTNASGTLTWNGVNIMKNSSGTTFTERTVNFIEGSNVTLTVADDPGNSRVNITINTTGGGGGGVDTLIMTDLPPLFTTSIANPSTSPTVTFTLTNAAAHKFFGNFTGSSAAPSYSSPTLASADFANQGTTTTLLHGGTTPSWSQVATADIINSNVTYAKIVDLPTQRLAGRYTAGTGVMQNISLSNNFYLDPITGQLSIDWVTSQTPSWQMVMNNGNFSTHPAKFRTNIIPSYLVDKWEIGVDADSVDIGNFYIKEDSTSNYALFGYNKVLYLGGNAKTSPSVTLAFNKDVTLSGYPSSRNDGAVTSGSTKLVYVDANGKLQVGTATFAAGSGSVTSVSVVTANGFAGTVATATTTPAITLTTSVTDTRVLYASSSAITGAAGFVFDGTSALTLGVAGTSAGKLLIKGSTSGTITTQGVAAAGTYNWNYPITAGTNGYLLTSGGGSSTAMTWTDPATFEVPLTFNSGLTRTGNTVKLGGTLLATTTENTGGFATTWTGANTDYILTVTNTQAFYNALLATSNGGYSIFGSSNNGGTAGGLYSENSGTTTILTVLDLTRGTTGTAANGIGARLTMNVERSDGIFSQATAFESVLTNATAGSEGSQLNIIGKASGSNLTFMNIQTGGIVRVNNNADTLATQAYARANGGGGGGSGVTTVGTFSGSSQTNGASISGSTITFGPADGTNPGMMTTGTQTIAGTKTFTTPSFTTGFTIGGAAASRKIIVGNGTNFVASTETWAVPGTSGNVLTSDGTNWLSSAPTGSSGMAIGGLITNSKISSIPFVGTGGKLSQDSGHIRYDSSNAIAILPKTTISGSNPVLDYQYAPSPQAIPEIDDGRWNFPFGIDWLPTGELISCWYSGDQDGGGHPRIILNHSKDQGQNWYVEAGDTILTSPIDTAFSGGTFKIAYTGRAFVFYAATDTTDGSVSHAIRIKHSDDYKHWSGAYDISKSGMVHAMPNGQAIRIGGDTLMFSFCGNDGTNWRNYIFKTGNNGESFTSNIISYSSSSLHVSEGSYTYLGGGFILGHIRMNTTGHYPIQVRSTDNGNTWTTDGEVSNLGVQSDDQSCLSTVVTPSGERIVESVYSTRFTQQTIERAYANVDSIISSGVAAWNPKNIKVIASTSGWPLYFSNPVTCHNPNLPMAGLAMVFESKTTTDASKRFFKINDKDYPLGLKVDGTLSSRPVTTTDTTNNKIAVLDVTTGDLKRYTGGWPTGSGSTSPAGNYGDVQLNRNSTFATPASDSLQFASAGLIIKGKLTASLSSGATTDSIVSWNASTKELRKQPSANILKATGTLNFGSTAAGTSSDLTITVTGAADGDVVSLGVPNGSTLSNGVFTAWVSATDTVTVRFTNTNLVTSQDPASGTFTVAVFKFN